MQKKAHTWNQNIFTCSWRFKNNQINQFIITRSEVSQTIWLCWKWFNGLQNMILHTDQQTFQNIFSIAHCVWMMASNTSVQCLLSFPGLIKDILQSSHSPGSGRRVVKSVVKFMHFCPVGDPEFLAQFLLGLKGQVTLIAFFFAYFHTVVLWHYPVVNSPLEETTLLKKDREWKKHFK